MYSYDFFYYCSYFYREKEEERLAKQRVRDQIEQDKLARKAKFGGGSDGSSSVSSVQPNPAPQKPVETTKPVQQNYSEVQLQIRLTNGATLKKTFGAKEPLSVVRVFIQMNRSDGEGPFTLMTPFPRKVFEMEDYEKPLDVLGKMSTVKLQ